jgi:hypothetical protein
MLLDPSNLLLLVLGVGVAALKLWALIDACVRPAPAYVLNGKLTKPAWVAILLLAVLLSLTGVLNILGLLGVIAAAVYLADVRPALRGTRLGGPWG